MNIWILSHLGSTEGTRITAELLSRSDVTVRIVDPALLELTVASGRLEVTHRDGFDLPDLVYTRLGSSAPASALDVLRQLEWAGVTCVNDSASLEASRDKLRSFQRMARAGLPIPETVLLGSRDALTRVRDVLGPPPYIVKLPVSSKGTGVTLVESLRSLRATLDMLQGLGQRALVQRFVASSKGADTRVLVLREQAVLAVTRQARGDEFRSNIYLGGADEPAPLDGALASLAESAAAAHGLAVAGVDLLRDGDRYVVAEVNGSPGLVGPYRQSPKLLERAFDALVEQLTLEMCR